MNARHEPLRKTAQDEQAGEYDSHAQILKSVDLRREQEAHDQALLIVSRTVDLHFFLLSGGG